MVQDPNSERQGGDSSRDAGLHTSAARFALVVRSADGDEREYELFREKTIIGRVQRCDLMVALPSVADQHCEIEIDDEGLVVTDLDTELGTHINGERVQTARVRNGDAISIGPMHFHVRDRHHKAMTDVAKHSAVEPKGKADSPMIETMRNDSNIVPAE